MAAIRLKRKANLFLRLRYLSLKIRNTFNLRKICSITIRFRAKRTIALLFSFGQRMVFGFLEGCLAVFMKFCQSLIASIRQNAEMLSKLQSVIFEKLEVMFASMTKGGGYDLSGLSGLAINCAFWV